MCNPTSENPKSCEPSIESVIYIIGPKRLQNEAIASCLKKETAKNCFVLGDISKLPSADSEYNVRPRLVLLDCQGKNLENILAELKPYILHKQPTNHVALFNIKSNLEIEKKCVFEGVRGFFYQSDPLDRLIKGVSAVLEGELWLCRKIMTECIFEGVKEVAASRRKHEVLTSRQVEILVQVMTGATNDEIADKLCVSLPTVKAHLSKIFKKINVPNRTQAAFWAAKYL